MPYESGALEAELESDITGSDAGRLYESDAGLDPDDTGADAGVP